MQHQSCKLVNGLDMVRTIIFIKIKINKKINGKSFFTRDLGALLTGLRI